MIAFRLIKNRGISMDIIYSTEFDESLLSASDYGCLCHNYIHTASTYTVAVVLINWLSVLWTNSTMDAQISKQAKILSTHILYAQRIGLLLPNFYH